MTPKTPTPDDQEPGSSSALKKQTVRDLDVKSKAGEIKGGLRTRKGGDPTEGGE
jgi:hypothetical protein